MGSRSRWLAAAIAVVALFPVALTLPDVGAGWDEATYLGAARENCGWFNRPTLATVDRYWGKNHEHPPLAKLSYCATRALFHVRLAWVDEITAARLGLLPFLWLLFYCLFRLVWRATRGTGEASDCGASTVLRRRGPLMGACLALALLVLMPRFFYHAHLATLDAPIASLWLATLYAQWRAHQRASHAWLAAALAGLALLTKLNAFFLVVPLGLSWGVQLGRTLRRPDRLRRLGPFFTRRTLPLLLLPPSILLLGWPWLWPAPWSRFVDYLQFHRQHFDIAVMVFGERLRTGPPHFPLLMLALTTPPVVLVGVLAAIRPLWRDRARIALFVFIPGLAASMGPLMLPGVPRYDGVRLFLPALPLLAAAAAIGLYSLCAARALWVSRVATLAVVVLVASAAAALGHHHPYPFAYWNAFIGGTRGAYAAGFDIDYFGSSYRQLLPRLAGAEPRRLHILGRVPESSYRQLGIIGPRVQLVGEGEARYFATINRPALFSPRLRALWREGLVVAEVALDGVPLSRVLVERERVGGPTGPRIK